MSERLEISGPCGPLENEVVRPEGPIRGAAVVCHPHPLYGGSMDNAVVGVTQQRLLARGLITARFNFRSVGRSPGEHDGGRGEQDDLRAVLARLETETHEGVWVAGYSFGAAVALAVLERGDIAPPGTLAVAPPLEHYDFSFLEHTSTPIAIVYGELDALTPEQALASARASWAGLRTVERVPGAGHDLGNDSFDELKAAIDRSLDALSLGTPSESETS